MSRFAKLSGLLVFMAVVLGGLWLLWPSVQPASATFTGGSYSPSAFSSHGEWSLDFHDGRFQLPRSTNTSHPTSLAGRYRLVAAEVQLTFDDPEEKPIVLHYRNVGGVAVLLDDAAALIFDSEHRLSTGQNAIYIRKEPRDTSSGLWWIGLFREFPDFAKAYPDSYRKTFSVSWSEYQRLRWRDFIRRHPALYSHLPSRLINW